MKTLILAATLAVFSASPVLAHEHAAPVAPTCEKMEDGKMNCCKKGEDGKMSCEMMDHADMNHNQMDHGTMDHNKMDHSKMNHSDMNHGDPKTASDPQ